MNEAAPNGVVLVICPASLKLKGTSRRLMSDSGLLKNEDGQNRTLCSRKYTYATIEILRGGNDIP